jgi:hypothetical protein
LSRAAPRLAAALLLLFGAGAGCGGGGGGSGASPSPSPRATASPSASASASGGVQPVTDLATVAEKVFGREFVLRSGGSFGAENLGLRTGSGRTVVRVTYPQGSASGRAEGDDQPRGGAQAYFLLRDGPKEDLHLRYLLKIPSDFDFVKGGKLPGLYGGSVTSGGKIPNGANGFSTRFMWRRAGAGEVYAYLPSSREHGTSLGRGSWTWPTGRWACIEQAVRLNTPGKQDGSVQVWLDGAHVLTVRDLVFRTADRLKIDGLFFSTFFGGGDTSWATPIQQQIEFADFSVSNGRIGCP